MSELERLEAPLKPLAKGTLSRQLVTRVGLLVAALALMLSVITTISVHTILLSALDRQLETAIEQPSRGRGQPRVPGPGGIEIRVTPMAREVTIGYDHGQEFHVNDIAFEQLLAVRADGRPHTVALDNLGDYRAIHLRGDAENRVVALPLSAVRGPVSQLILAEIFITLLAVAAASFAVYAVVRRSLTSLNRLATAATEVSRRELSHGDVDLNVRMSPTDADPDNEVGRVGLAFNRMLDNVEDALAARHASETKVRQFVADASHELRNPLAAIRGYAELTARQSTDLPADAAFAVSRIEAESNRMSALVDDMLLLARLDNDPQVASTLVDIVEVALNAAQDARAAGPNHIWLLNLPEESIQVRGDANQLHQVVGNLLTNARKHTPSGTTVRVDVRTSGPNVVLTVADNGPGVPESIKANAFERFARADVARAHDAEGSTGLGLAIVASVVEAHGGTVTLDSEPHATRFTVTLPLAIVTPTLQASN